MKFNAFPIELKDIIMSFFSPEELCSIVAPVSRQWHALAYDYVKWKVLRFKYEHRRSARAVTNILNHARPYKVQFTRHGIFDFELRHIPICETVRELHCTWCNFSCASGVKVLVKCFPNIQKLVIDRDLESYQGLTDGKYLIKRWKNLKSLKLRGVAEDYARWFLVSVVKEICRFEELSLLNSEEITDDIFKSVIKYQKPKLRKFTMFFNRISRNAYQHLTLCDKLSHLAILWPKNMTDDELLLILTGLRTLTNFQIEYARNLFSANFGLLFNDVVVPELVDLTVGVCNKFDNNALKQFVKCMPSLKGLTLRRVNKVKDEGLETLVKIGRNLEMLYFNELKSISENCLRQLALELPNMRELVAFKCPKVGNGEKFEIIFKRTYRLTKIL